jgi:hypothetical protein
MKRTPQLFLRLALVSGLLLAATPASAVTVTLSEVPLSQQLASTVTTITPQCYNCSSLSVHAFSITSPSTAVTVADAFPAAIDALWAYYYGPGPQISQATFSQRMANFNYEELPPEIRNFADPTDTTWLVGESYWYYETAPDYCDYGHLYVLVFNRTHKVVTVEINSGHDC